MKQLFERTSSCWVRYDKYVIRTDAKGTKYVTAAEDKTPLRMRDSCDTLFVANRKNQRYCCDKCRRKGE